MFKLLLFCLARLGLFYLIRFMEVLNVVIIDDEVRSIELLEFLLTYYCPSVKIVATFTDA